MKLRMRSKLVISFSIILLVFLINIGLSINSIRNSNNSITKVKNFTYKQVEYSNDINISIIQVKQFLTDASVTKNLDGLKDADKNKAIFKDSIAKLQEINPNIKDKIKKLDTDFDSYYSTGVKMANAYINEGFDAGNTLMSTFDPLALNMSAQINELNLNSKNSMNADLDTIYNTMNTNIKISTGLGIVSLFIAIIVIRILGGSITIPVNNMLHILKDLEIGEGDLTKRINVKSNSIIVSQSSESIVKGAIQFKLIY